MLVQRLSKFWQYGLGRTMAATLAAHSNSISVGMCQGYSAILVPQLQHPDQDPDTSLGVSDEDASWIAALGVISTPLGALLSGILVEILGRKAVVQITNLPLLIGWICIALSSSMPSLCIGRFITGVGQGMGTSAAYVYVAEVSPAEYRGPLSACGPVLVSIGVLTVYSMGMVASWNYVAALCAVFVLLSFAIVSLIPESPPWLASRGRVQEALTALIWLRRSTAVADREVAELVASVDIDKEELTKHTGNVARYVSYFKTPQVWKPFLILLAFFAFQEGSGIYVLLFYAVSLFQDVGTEMNEYLASIWLACMRLFMAGLGAVAIQKVNRTTLATFSGTGMAIAMAIAGTYCHLYWRTEPGLRPLPWIPLVCFLAHVCVSMLGYLQLPWIMSGELFPLRVRGVMGGLITSLAHLLIFSSVKTYPNLREAMGMDGLLWAFATVAGCGALFAYFLLPETRGRTLREIEASFTGNSTQSENGAQIESGLPPTKDPTVFTITLSGGDLKGRLR